MSSVPLRGYQSCALQGCSQGSLECSWSSKSSAWLFTPSPALRGNMHFVIIFVVFKCNCEMEHSDKSV